MKTRYKHIEFEQVTPDRKRKTQIWEYKNHDGVYLGEVKWHTGWRQYCRYPAADTVFSNSCSDGISHFIKQLMDARA